MLSICAMLFAVKRLSQVEVAPGATKARVELGEPRSNQHEFNAGKIRTGLRLGKETTSASLKFLFFLSNDQPPLIEDGAYTIYNAREGKPRAAEYRLYYTSKRVTELARAGDLFVIFRPNMASDDLTAVVAREGTQVERELLSTLEVDADAALRQFTLKEPEPLSKATASTLAQSSLFATVATPAFSHPLLSKAIEARSIPPARTIAAAAQGSMLAMHGDLPPDAFVSESVDEESRLYFAIEKAVKERELEQMIASGSRSLESVLAFTLSIQQSRKARRGHSLQFHFEALLTREQVPFSPQCVTENGETPDIVVPGKRQYADAAFPSQFLRMVACKSTLRERWGQVLREADRIDDKYLLTLDPGITFDVIANMRKKRLFPFAPAAIRDVAYPGSREVGTVKDLLDLLQEAVGEARRGKFLA